MVDILLRREREMMEKREGEGQEVTGWGRGRGSEWIEGGGREDVDGRRRGRKSRGERKERWAGRKWGRGEKERGWGEKERERKRER